MSRMTYCPEGHYYFCAVHGVVVRPQDYERDAGCGECETELEARFHQTWLESLDPAERLAIDEAYRRPLPDAPAPLEDDEIPF